MPLPKSRKDREYQKFVDDGAGNTAVRAVVIGGGTPLWNLVDAGKSSNGAATAEGLEYSVTEVGAGTSTYSNKAGQSEESHNDGALTYDFSKNSQGQEEKVVGITALGIVHTAYNENQSGNADNDVIFGQEFKANAIIGAVVTETVFGRFIAKIKAAINLPSIVYTLLGVANDPYLEIDDVSHKIYKPLFTSSATRTLITNLTIPLADTITLTLVVDGDTVLSRMEEAGSSTMGQVVYLIIPSGVTVTNRAVNSEINLEFHLDGNVNLVTIGTTILHVKCMGDMWLQMCPVSVVS